MTIVRTIKISIKHANVRYLNFRIKLNIIRKYPAEFESSSVCVPWAQDVTFLFRSFYVMQNKNYLFSYILDILLDYAAREDEQVQHKCQTGDSSNT